jgi:hypothetical protein
MAAGEGAGKGEGGARLMAPVVLISFISENEFRNERERGPDSGSAVR